MPGPVVRPAAVLLPSLALGLVLGAVAACQSRNYNAPEGSSGVKEFQTRNLTGSSFGLKAKEVVLTLDDGPGPRTLEVAKWLAENNVPTTFFMVGREARGRASVVKAVAEMKLPDGRPAHIIANHSWTHENDLGRSRTSFSTVRDEVGNADDILKSNVKGSFFFRPPFGSLVGAGKSRIDGLNGSGDLSKYIGPVFWDIGGDLSGGFSADWACWRDALSVTACHDGYVRETRARGKGIILAHDVHSKTVDMLMGTGGAPSLIKTLRAAGFKFVSLDAYPESVKQWGTYKDRKGLPGLGSVEGVALDVSKMRFTVTVPGATRLEVWVDRLATPLKTSTGNSLTFEQTFSTAGSRILTLKGFKGDVPISEDAVPFTVGTSTSKPTTPPPAEDEAKKEANAEVCKSLTGEINVRNESLTQFAKANPGEPLIRTKKTKSNAEGTEFEEVFFLMSPSGTGWIAKNFICDL